MPHRTSHRAAPHRYPLAAPSAAALIVAAAAVTLFAQADAPPAATAPTAAAALDPQKLRGLVAPRRQVQLKAPIDGLLDAVHFEENAPVNAGDLLFAMDTQLQRAAVDIASLEVRRNDLALQDAQLQLDRVEQLLKTSSAQEWEVRRKRVERDLADVALQHARRTLELELTRLARHEMRAPFAGVVIRRAAQPGATLRAGDDVLTVIEIHPLEARLFLPAELYGKLAVGQTYRFAAGSPVNRTIQGTLKSFEPLIDSASSTFRCVFTIDNPDCQLPAGFPVTLQLDGPTAAAQPQR